MDLWILQEIINLNGLNLSINEFGAMQTWEFGRLTSLVLSANSQENGGRFNFELTGQTRCQVAATPVAQVSSGVTDYSANFSF